ncbi:MAG TPA: hypothetical protein VJL29_11430 [Thermoguttaceae bacterium]|nr:hypothetical protein [Thermoguttaceae bacterium]
MAAETASADQDRAAHLQQAAEHLQAAGLKSLAVHVRELSSASVGPQSRNRPRSTELRTQVLFHLKLIELDATGIRRLGAAFARVSSAEKVSGQGPLQNLAGVMSAEERKTFSGLLDTLRTDGLVKVLAEPTLVTIMGRPASFHVGGEIMIPESIANGKPILRPRPYGTTFDVLPILTDGGRLHLELRCKNSELDRTRSVTVNGQEVPGFNDMTMETALEMELGQSFLLLGATRAARDKATSMRELTTAIFVTAENVTPIATSTSPNQSARR